MSHRPPTTHLALLAGLACLAACVQRQDLTFTIEPDGSARIRCEVVCRRQELAARVDQMVEDGYITPTELPAKHPDGSPVTEEERLAHQVRALIVEQFWPEELKPRDDGTGGEAVPEAELPEAELPKEVVPDAAEPEEVVPVPDAAGVPDEPGTPTAPDPPPAPATSDDPPAGPGTDAAEPSSPVALPAPPETLADPPPPADPPVPPVVAGIEAVEVAKETVRIVIEARFADVFHLLKYSHGFLQQIGVEQWRLELDEAGRLRSVMRPQALSFPPETRTEWREHMLRFLKQGTPSGMIVIELPGAVTGSSLPATEGRRASLVYDGTTDAGREALVDAMLIPLVVVGDAGDLDRDLFPLETAGPGQDPRQGSTVDGWGGLAEVPAATPFRAEPVTLTTSFEHRFGADQAGAAADRGSCTLSLRILPPAGRELILLQSLRVLSAEDDRGRAVGIVGVDPAEEEDPEDRFHSMPRQEPAAAGVLRNLQLELPQPDAVAVERLRGKAVGITCSGWRRRRLPLPERVAPAAAAPEAGQPAEGDGAGPGVVALDDLVPGAVLRWQRCQVRQEGQMIQVQCTVELTGPAGIARLRPQLVLAKGSRDETGTPDEDVTRRHQGRIRRRLVFSLHSWMDPAPKREDLHLHLAAPEDVRLEAGTFELTGLDLL